MKVFISWSGDDSRQIAQQLSEWLPMVMQSVEPYMSAESIEKGERWATSIANELSGTHVGLLVLTPSNVSAPWINFEAGALAKVVDQSRLSPLLFGLLPSDLKSPLSQFQATQFNKSDYLALLKSINNCDDGGKLGQELLSRMHNALWDNLSARIQPLVENLAEAKKQPDRKEDDQSVVLQELLVLARQQASYLHVREQANSNLISRMHELEAERDMANMQLEETAIRTNDLLERWRILQDAVVLSMTVDASDADHKATGIANEGFERKLLDLLALTSPNRRRSRRFRLVRDETTGKITRVHEGEASRPTSRSAARPSESDSAE